MPSDLPPPRPDGQPRPGDGQFRRGRVLAIVAAVVLVVAVALVLAASLAPHGVDGYGPQAESRFVGWCQRAGGATEGCRCAYRALADGAPFARAEEVERDGAAQPTLPEDLARLVRSCAS